jgi:flagellar biosynthetic protein FliP
MTSPAPGSARPGLGGATRVLAASGERRRRVDAEGPGPMPAILRALAGAVGLALVMAGPAAAQDISINFGQGNTVTERAVQLVALITILSIAPSIVVMVTSFTRIVVVLSLLRTAIGLQTAPPNSVMISLALFLTAFVMSPVFNQAYEEGIKPLTENSIELDQAIERTAQPFHVFMRNHVREKDLELFINLAGETRPATPEDVSYRVLIPAFMISELRRAFEIGFLLYMPFLIIDLVVASVLMSMGMMMLPPVTISLPFKLIFFVLVDGWNLVAGSLVKSFG